MESIARRKGTCDYKNCGCCDYFFCKNYDSNSKKCMDYENRPLINCKLFPFDEKDITRRLKGVCKFYWEDD